MRGVDVLLRLEAAALFAAGVFLWFANGGPILLWLAAILLPDLSAIGYLAGTRIGAMTYNALHNLVLALALIGLGWWLDAPGYLLAGAILVAHIGIDRALGFGLKLPSGFGDTHLGHIGKR